MLLRNLSFVSPPTTPGHVLPHPLLAHAKINRHILSYPTRFSPRLFIPAPILGSNYNSFVIAPNTRLSQTWSVSDNWFGRVNPFYARYFLS